MTAWFLALYILNVLLQAADAVLTARILANGGREKNPFVAWLMDKIGVRTTLFVTKSVVLVALLVAQYLPLLVFGAIVYTYVVSYNFRQWKE